MIRKLTRRDFVLFGASSVGAGALGVGVGYWAGVRREKWKKRVPPRGDAFSPNVFVAIEESGDTLVWLTKSEMGQGVYTALPAILIDELGGDFRRVRVELASANRIFGDQATVASESVRALHDELRTAGAAAREMLVAAGARVLGVPAEACDSADGFVVHGASGRRIDFGALVPAARQHEVPSSPAMRPTATRSLVGKAFRRLDTPAKVDGTARFGIDVRVPGMKFAAVARPPSPKGTVAGYDERAARSVPGVVDVVAIDTGIAVVADDTWSAFRGRDALAARFTAGPPPHSTAQLEAALRASTATRGAEVKRVDDAEAAVANAARRVEATYDAPFLAHATMEPPNCTAFVERDRCTVWAPTQSPQDAQAEAMDVLGWDESRVVVHLTFLGGGFGRRSYTAEVREAVQLSKHARVPVMVVWSREDDVRHDFYRPAFACRLRAAVSADGLPAALAMHIASPSLMGRDSTRGEVDDLAVDGLVSLPYRVPALHIEWSSAIPPVRIGIWRSVGHSTNAFALESFIDELAVDAGRSPIDYRRSLLAGDSRERRVLDRLEEVLAGDAEPLTAEPLTGHRGPNDVPATLRGRGIALHPCFGSVCAVAVEVRAEARLVVERVVAVVDCGAVVHPDGVRAQIEGGVAFALSAALRGRIDVEDGAVSQSNFHDYEPLRIDEMPAVTVEILESDAAPGGVGELVVPLVAPALANAVFRATGKRVRSLPIPWPPTSRDPT